MCCTTPPTTSATTSPSTICATRRRLGVGVAIGAPGSGAAGIRGAPPPVCVRAADAAAANADVAAPKGA